MSTLVLPVMLRASLPLSTWLVLFGLMLAAMAALYLWASQQTSMLDTFVPEPAGVVEVQLPGPLPAALGNTVAALAGVPGVTLVDHRPGAALFSVMPTPSSMDRGYGAFVLATISDGRVELRGRRKVRMPATRLGTLLDGLEREVRNHVRPDSMWHV
ncbi:hypothetical protein EV383_4803 [Pseudonocardia sediminis]|uniref:Uncharacterized protein n=1 Tax=Pseudonocardia sediminis TaxID=1397368 RepID=A0A4Q7V368_PSEST|nr:hypothetical protein [Pseudonocardia sediminis]RZT87871.1 hypothetical protein EV383_4803 [Pseudonocardia sediminis]